MTSSSPVRAPTSTRRPRSSSIVDDSAHVDLELIEDEEEGAEWILLGDDPAIDEHKRDELVEAFETRRARSSTREDPDEDEVDEEDELEPDPDESD